ncbi:MFS transporter [Pedobacter miscanthi]|uniref:MFS transporter n=1 Tax=Pedobacter miscanthi TaxID=2259170 RepID=UPI0029316AD4|nr:MFS transporter [Pedobacter miscanthi]
MNSITVNNSEIRFGRVITPIILSVFAVYLTIGMTLGVLPGFVKNDLKFDSVIVGLVIGLQSLATLLTRAYSGKLTDTKGAATSSRRGIYLIVISGIMYISATFSIGNLWLALVLVIIARIIHGISESLSITGALTRGIALVGAQKSGKVMTWNGIAMYSGIALGVPLSIWMKGAFGIIYVFTAMIVLSAISWLATSKLPVVVVEAGSVRPPFYKVIGLVSGQGLGLAFAAVGFACISSFISLLFASRGLGNPSSAFISFGGCYILTRVFCSSYPDRFGGYKVAIISLVIELFGQLLIWYSASALVAVIGCGITGIGFSLIFPSLGVLAIKKVSPQMRGTALGAYAAFFDLSLGITGPIAGIVASWYSYQAIYLFGGISCLLAILILFFSRNR